MACFCSGAPQLARASHLSLIHISVVEGRLQMRDWTDKDGNKRVAAEVVADNVYFGDSKRDGDAPSYGGRDVYKRQQMN